MKFNLDQPATIYVVRGYGPGTVRIGERDFTRSLIVTPTQLIEDWRPARIEDLQAVDLEPLVALRPEVLLIGSGARQRVSRPGNARGALRRPARVRNHGHRRRLPHLQRARGGRPQRRRGADRRACRTDGPRATPLGSTRIARKSLTLVRVGPVTTESPSASKNECASLASRNACGASPRRAARASVSGVHTAPATGSVPSTPSVSQASA